MSTRQLSPFGLSCWRCWSQGWAFRARPAPQQQQQVRGKKKSAKEASSTVNVRLLQDVVKYGRQGAIVPVAAGRMRNDWFPRRVAEYVTKVQLRELNMKEASFDRDVTFGMVQEIPETEEEEPMEVPLELLSPERTTELLSQHVPPFMDFYRTPILHAAMPSGELSSTSQSTAQPFERAAIYGSVSTADIANSIKALLANDKEGSRVVLTPENLRFVDVGDNADASETDGTMAEVDRVKRLGSFNIRIQVHEDRDSIHRLIRVHPQASDPGLVQDPTAS
ncbi:MAG: hypothetical protein M1823_000850 [Watsoniomyces obsoletus]|nr:MAG: hypothetical protein M1823_000850 [Watsoniomyces obsoletus]